MDANADMPSLEAVVEELRHRLEEVVYIWDVVYVCDMLQEEI